MAPLKRLSLDAAAGKLAIAMQKRLKSMSPSERLKRVKALDALAKVAANRLRRNRGGSPSRSGSTDRIPACAFAAKAQ